MKLKLSLFKTYSLICIGIVNNIEKSVDMIISFGIQTKWTEIRPLMGKWSEFRPAQKNQTRVATVPISRKKYLISNLSNVLA